MKQPETNVKFIKRVMEFSESGVMMQLFVMQALISYTEHVLANEESVRKGMENSMIHPDAWIAAAKELKKELDIKMPPPKKD